MTIWIAVVVYLVVLVFALALCKAAGDADRRSEIEYLKRQKEKFNMDIIVKEWVSHNEAEIYTVSCGGVSGGWFNRSNEGHRWKDYIKTFDDNVKLYLEAIRKEVIDNNLKFGGNTHREEMTPLFSDDTIGRFSYRAWGDLMAAIWSEEENKNYSYIHFYMTLPGEWAVWDFIASKKV